MAVRSILRFPDPKLRQKSDEVGDIGDDLRQLVADMTETMMAANGAGLAAIQVGVPARLFIVDGHVTGGAEDSPPKVFINPEILAISDESQTGDEGCLSFPDVFVPVKRGMRARVRARDLDGNIFEDEGEGSTPELCSTRPTTSTGGCSSIRSGRSSASSSSASCARTPRSKEEKEEQEEAAERAAAGQKRSVG